MVRVTRQLPITLSTECGKVYGLFHGTEEHGAPSLSWGTATFGLAIHSLVGGVALASAVVAVANDICVLHVRGVSSRARPLFVEWHKHRGLWRYFRKFESPQRSLWIRLVVWCAIWTRFALGFGGKLLKSRD